MANANEDSAATLVDHVSGEEDRSTKKVKVRDKVLQEDTVELSYADTLKHNI